MTASLKPCPFCGCTDIRIAAHPGCGSYPYHVGETIYTIGCYGCGGAVPGRYRRELLVETWNRREPPPHAVEAEMRINVKDRGLLAEARYGVNSLGENCAVCIPTTKDVKRP